MDILGSVTTSEEGRPRPRRIGGLDAEERRARRRDLVLDAALGLFAERGYQSTSIELICQTANVSTKSFYELFDGREACYLALYRRTSACFRDRVGAAYVQVPDDEIAAARYLLDCFIAVLMEDPRQAQVTFGMSRAISQNVEHARRDNRRWAATFIDAMWRRNGVEGNHHRIAVAFIGGSFDVIADWLLDADLSDLRAQLSLVDDLTAFYTAVRQGVSGAAPTFSPDSVEQPR